MRPIRPQRRPTLETMCSIPAEDSFQKMRLPKHSWQEVLLYASGMMCIVLGIASSIISIDPRPFPSSCWWYFLVAGIALIVVGCLLLRIVICAPVYTKSFFPVTNQSANDTVSSVAELLNDTQSVAYGDSPIIHLQDVEFGIDEPGQVVKQCMMTSSDALETSVYFYYKETFV